MNWVTETIGITASIIILISMLFKTTTIKGSIIMRSINIIGSIIFIIYGCLLPAISTAVLNFVLVLINTYHLVILAKDYAKYKTVETKK